MLDNFLQFLQSSTPIKKGDKILLACSGGIDSMVLGELLLQSGYTPDVAHAQFGLRGEDSLQDEAFVAEWCHKNQLNFYRKDFSHSEKIPGESTQMWARRMRYEWFLELREQKSIQWIVTAHHADDAIETLMMQLLRGMTPFTYPGIRVQRDTLIRPLLFAEKSLIKKYAETHSISWREDKSNASNDYERNRIRNAILPLLKQYKADTTEELKKLLAEMQEKHIRWIRSFETFGSGISWKKKNSNSILQLEPYKTNRLFFWYLYHQLIPQGFSTTQIQDLYRGIENQKSGIRFFAQEKELLLDRSQIVLRSLDLPDNGYSIEISGPGTYVSKDYTIKVYHETENKNKKSPPHRLVLDTRRFSYPFHLRLPKEGERIRPFGMQGSKKISDVYTDRKTERIQREITPLLIHQDTPLWLAGIMHAEETRAEEDSGEFICFEISFDPDKNSEEKAND